MAGSDLKLLEIAGMVNNAVNGFNWLEMDGMNKNGWKLMGMSGMAVHGCKWLDMAVH